MSLAKRCDYCEQFFTYDKTITTPNAIRFSVFNEYDTEITSKGEPWRDICPVCVDKMKIFISEVLKQN
jgi:hypothetical protein